jgi:hypothetical protein
MTEYELVDVINSASSNAIAAQALFMTGLSAYLVVAFAVGKSLTTYQVCFVNFVFVLFVLIGLRTVLGFSDMFFRHYEMLVDMRGAEGSSTLIVSQISVLGMRAVLLIGALIFMWQVRHPKAEDV